MLRKYYLFSQRFVTDFLVRFPIYKPFEDDLLSECFFAVEKAIKHYHYESGLFYAYWKRCAKRVINKFITRSKDLVVFETLTLDDIGGNLSLHDVAGENDEQIKTKLLNEAFLTIVNDPKNRFTKTERNIIKLFLYGYELKDIALLLDLKVPNVYHHFKVAVDKIGKKMKLLK